MTTKSTFKNGDRTNNYAKRNENYHLQRTSVKGSKVQWTGIMKEAQVWQWSTHDSRHTSLTIRYDTILCI